MTVSFHSIDTTARSEALLISQGSYEKAWGLHPSVQVEGSRLFLDSEFHGFELVGTPMLEQSRVLEALS